MASRHITASALLHISINHHWLLSILLLRLMIVLIAHLGKVVEHLELLRVEGGAGRRRHVDAEVFLVASASKLRGVLLGLVALFTVAHERSLLQARVRLRPSMMRLIWDARLGRHSVLHLLHTCLCCVRFLGYKMA